MNNDRELLELAARAAGLDCVIDSYADKKGLIFEPLTDCEEGRPMWWNPLDNDGDALRLAVKLHLTCRHFMGETVAQSTVPGGPPVYITATCHRRAITIAAAEIGKAMG